jgi:predicted dinucleotide-binding enzyme
MTRSEAEDLAARLRRRLRPLDVESLARARQLEQLGFLHISLQQPHNR